VNSRCSVLLLLASVFAFAQSAQKITIVPDVSVSVPETWSVIRDTRSTYLLEHHRQAKKPDASMNIQVEKRRDHAEAVNRLAETRATYPESYKTMLIAGWPALERRFVAPLQHPGEQEAPGARSQDRETAVHAATTIAVGDNVIHFRTVLQPGADPGLAEQAFSIARSLTAPGADQERSQRELRQIESSSPPAAPPAPKQFGSTSEGTAARATKQKLSFHPGAGSVSVSGAGEIEAAASIDGQSFVIDASCAISFSNNGGASFGGSNINRTGTPPNLDGDCTVAGGRNPNFYLGQLGTDFVALYRSNDQGVNFSYVTTAVDRRSISVNVDQPHVTADRWNASATNQDFVYVAWQETSNFVSRLACSSDGGSTWSTPVDANSGDGGYPRVAVGRDGMVYVVSRQWPNEIILDKFGNCDSGLVEQPGFPVFRTFSDIIGANCVGGAIPGLDRCNDGNTLASPTIAVDDIDPNHVYLGWAETNASNTGQDIRIADSHNGGLNFGAPLAANGPAAAVRFMPWLGAWGGVAYVGWYDRRFAGTTVSDPNDSTRYFRGSVSSVGGALTLGPEFDLMGRDDPQCASGWAGGTREPQDATSCTVQPQLAGICGAGPGRCDFNTGCSGGQVCNTGNGSPKYGDYNGLATGGGRLLNIWASGTAPSDLPPAPNNNLKAYVVITDLPSDFFVRDWTNGAADHDNGQEPSTNPIFYASSDVWNQSGSAPEPLVNDWVLGDPPVRTSSDFAFARISRRAPAASTAASVSVSVDFLMADFGLGVPFVDLGTNSITLTSTDNTAITPGLAWTVPPTSSTHLCIAAQVSTPGDPFRPPSLLGGSPGLAGTDPLVLQDNNKAQRNLLVSKGLGGAGGESYAIIHNIDATKQDIELAYSIDPSTLPFVSGGSLKIVGTAAVPLASSGSVVLKDMAPGEDRWLELKFGDISSPLADSVIFRFNQVNSGSTVNGFAIAFRREDLPAVIVDRLQSQIDVLTRLWSITHDEELKEAVEETVEHAKSHEITEFKHYRDFLEDHFKDLRRAITKDSGASLASDPFGLFDALNQLKTSIKSKNPTTLTVAHDVLLQRLDAHLTWRQRSHLPIP
jgi:hypothetical protein